MYKIVHKDGWVAACNFANIGRATAWLEKFNPQHYTDKTLKVEDFEIRKE